MIDVKRGGATLLTVVAAAAMGLCSCKAPGGPDRIGPNEFGPPRDAAPPSTPPVVDADIAVMTSAICAPATSSERMPPRSTLISATAAPAAPAATTMFTSDLYERFSKVCGTCHVQSSLGGFSVTPASFGNVVTKMILMNSIMTDAPAKYMPPMASPNGMPFSQRAPTDPVAVLADLLGQWIDQGRPADAFVVTTAMPTMPATDTGPSYAMSEALGAQMTNIGTCVPEKGMVGTDTADVDRLDAFFAAATDLPPTLDQTDLFTLDSAVLAQNRVISFAPAYPLWTDNAGKMRFIRVPRGQAVTFDKTTQRFTIPPNTRFYKTFLKPVVDANGNSTFRKIETRVIVSRPDKTLPDGTVQQTALYGTYVWSDDESQAVLLADPLNNGKPFADRMKTYITDEQMAQPIIDSKPANLEQALTRAGVLRHYALPGAERCVQCHMGSDSASFILGFKPIQIARHPQGTSGVIEPAMGDELTQLQRFIDYGIIQGMTSPDDVLPLEKSQGTRPPRNDAELTAQSYMLGNCSHCHNPRGFPSTKNPALRDLLDFLPSATGGIFQFPLDKMSPTRKRGVDHDIPMPYITPSLYDRESDQTTGKFFCPTDVKGGGLNCGDLPTDFVYAPWRSLIYRNIDTPYDYFDDATPFPHMPLDSPGYDCRATKILGDWMIGIPAKLTSGLAEYVAPSDFGDPDALSSVNRDSQPFIEVHPGEPDYDLAVMAAKVRIDQYHGGHRYGFCPKGYTADIVDSFIQDEVDRNVLVTTHHEPTVDPQNPKRLIMGDLAIPARPHWVNFDDTDPPGDWFPRRPDWQTYLSHPDIPKLVKAEISSPGKAQDDLTNVLTALQTVTLDATTRQELLKSLPFGLWQAKSGCDFSGLPKAKDFVGADRPQWMATTKVDPEAPVYVESAGAAVFTTICYNCHGVQADSKGLLADEISIMTGGAARVANFRDGLFGPVMDPGANRTKAFSPALQGIGGGATVDDVAARYMAWMALGGTSKHLPLDVLNQVSTAPVLGVTRTNVALAGTPDMLRLGLELCQQIALASLDTNPKVEDFVNKGTWGWSSHRFGVVDSNGDAEMWLRLCSLNNRPIVRVLSNTWSAKTDLSDFNIGYYSEYWGASDTGADWYGQGPVMDQRGQVKTGLTSDNWFPLCIQKPTAPAEVTFANQFLQAHPVGGPGGNVIPFCPDGFATADRALKSEGTGADTHYTDGPKWAARGAINAALSVFLYLDQVERDSSKRQPLFSQCELLPKKM